MPHEVISDSSQVWQRVESLLTVHDFMLIRACAFYLRQQSLLQSASTCNKPVSCALLALCSLAYATNRWSGWLPVAVSSGMLRVC